MSTLTLYPDGDLNVQQGFDALGADGVNTLHLTPGEYGASQGIANIFGKSAPEGTFYEVHLEGAVIDLGCDTWDRMFLPNGYGRTVWVGLGYRFTGEGAIQNGSARMIRSKGDLVLDGLTVRCAAGLGLLAPCEGGSSVEVLRSRFEDIGIDPVLGDPVWGIVGRVPVGTVLETGGISFDIHKVVARVGLTSRIVYAENPDIVDNSGWETERLIMYYLCKQLGSHGDGLKALYISGGREHLVGGNVFRRVSGQVVHFKGAHDASIRDNDSDYCHALYHSNHGCTNLRVERNITTLRYRHDNGPRRAKGFAQNSAEPPYHGENTWTYFQHPSVHAFSVLYESGTPVSEGEKVYSDDGEPVPIQGGGLLPAEKIPVKRVVTEVKPDSLERDLSLLATYKSVPVEARLIGVFETAIELRDYADLWVRFMEDNMGRSFFTGVETERADGRAALVIDRCKSTRLIDPVFLECSGAGLYAGFSHVEIEGLEADRMGWNAANIYRCTGSLKNTLVRDTNQEDDGKSSGGGVKITRCGYNDRNETTGFLIDGYDGEHNFPCDLWIDHGNRGVVVRKAGITRLINEKNSGAVFEDCSIGEGDPDAVQLRGAPDTTFRDCAISTWGKEKIVIAGNVPEIVDGEEFYTERTVFENCTVSGQRLTQDDPYNFRFSGDSITGRDRFLSTVDDRGLEFIPIDDPVDPPDPPDPPPPEEYVTHEEFGAEQARRDERDRDQDAALDSHAATLSKQSKDVIDIKLVLRQIWGALDAYMKTLEP